MMNSASSTGIALSVALLLHLLPVTIPAQTPEAPDDLVGPVKQVEVSERVTKGNSASLQGEKSRREVLRFDDGDLIEQLQFLPKNDFLWRTAIEYDSQGRVVAWRSFDDEGNLNWRYEYTYDDKGRRRREVVYGPDGSIDRILVREYQNGRLVQKVMYDGNNAVEWRQAYDYSENGRIKQWSVFYPDGSRIKQVTQHRDKQGRVSKEVHVNEVGIAYEKIHYEYNRSSELTQIEVYNERDKLIRREEYEFDHNGNAILERVSRPQRDYTELILRSYTYDEWGNWVKQKTTRRIVRDDKESVVEEKIIRREITYEERE